jgi:hypothetical protein
MWTPLLLLLPPKMINLARSIYFPEEGWKKKSLYDDRLAFSNAPSLKGPPPDSLFDHNLHLILASETDRVVSPLLADPEEEKLFCLQPPFPKLFPRLFFVLGLSFSATRFAWGSRRTVFYIQT